MNVRLPVILLLVSSCLAAAGPGMSGEGGADQDSTSVFEWSAVFMGSLDKDRESLPFEWNAPARDEWSSGRLAADFRFRPERTIELMLRASAVDEAGERGAGMYLEKGHFAIASAKSMAIAKLFTRERVFRTGNRLILPLSSDSEMLDGRAEGIQVGFSAGDRYEMGYTGAALRGRQGSLRHGGLPVMYGWEGGINILSARARASFIEAGAFILESRSPVRGDGVLSGIDLGIEAGGYRLQIEMAGWREGRLGETDQPLLPVISPERVTGGRVSGAFAEDDAISIELHGIGFDRGRAGRGGLIPGYFFSGRDFSDPVGEIPPGLVESMLTAWWRHPEKELSLFIRASDLDDRRGGRSGAFLDASVRSRLKSGLETMAALVMEEYQDPAAVLSIQDENERTRLRMTARLEGAGTSNELSFLAQGHINLTGRMALRTSLYMESPERSLYSLQLEYRSGRRFLFRAGLGDYHPDEGPVSLSGRLERESAPVDRHVTISARIALGEL